jgi:RNA polymerase sigma-70 factor (ECF subfamily)
MSPTEQQQLEAARAGDPEALEALLQEHQARIYRFAMKLCRDPEDARDVLQDTLLAVARSLRDFRGGASLSTWLYTIARSFCIKARRKSKFAPAHEEPLEVGAEVAAPDGTGPEDIAAQHEIGAALDRSIRALDPEQREVLVLRDIEGLKATEVAEVLGLSVPAVKSRLHRARLRLREDLAVALGIGEAVTPSPTCPDVLELYSRNLEGEVSGELCAQMERHLASCARCQGACDSLKRTLALCGATPEPAVPPEIQASVRRALREFLGAT